MSKLSCATPNAKPGSSSDPYWELLPLTATQADYLGFHRRREILVRVDPQASPMERCTVVPIGSFLGISELRRIHAFIAEQAADRPTPERAELLTLLDRAMSAAERAQAR